MQNHNLMWHETAHGTAKRGANCVIDSYKMVKYTEIKMKANFDKKETLSTRGTTSHLHGCT